jgi:hypothetical protein
LFWLVEERRVLDSTPLYDAVATMDTITLIRSAIRVIDREPCRVLLFGCGCTAR